MYIASSVWQGATASLETILHLVNDARIHAVETRGLHFDSRFLAPTEPAPSTVNLFLLVEGRAQVDARWYDTPCYFAVGPDEFERREPAARAFRFEGEPRRSIEVCLGVDRLHASLGLTHGAHPLPESVTRAARSLFDRELSQEARVERASMLIAALAEHRLCTLPVDVDDGERGASLQRVVSSFVALFRNQDKSAYGKVLADLAQVSVRQATRDVSTLYRRFRLPGSSPRELFRVLRLRRVTLFLSAQDESLEDVARAVGYSGLDAMSRALRDAGLPPPGEIRRRLRGE